MFRTANLKLYRKFLILAILLGGLFFAASMPKTSAFAAICCSVCDNNFDTCTNACFGGDPRNLNKCLDHCDDAFNHCFSGPPHCIDGC